MNLLLRRRCSLSDQLHQENLEVQKTQGFSLSEAVSSRASQGRVKECQVQGQGAHVFWCRVPNPHVPYIPGAPGVAAEGSP